MKIFLDTADVDLIGKYHESGLIDGVTTNPTLIRKSGRDPEQVYKELTIIGVDDILAMVGLPKNAMYNAIKAGGNYGEIFENNLGATSGINIERGVNASWTKGGILYSPPFR